MRSTPSGRTIVYSMSAAFFLRACRVQDLAKPWAVVRNYERKERLFGRRK